MRVVMRLLPVFVALALFAGCGEEPPRKEEQAERKTPTLVDTAELDAKAAPLIEKTRVLCRRQGLSDDEILAAELDAFQAAGIENGIAFDELVVIPYQKFLAGGSKFVLTAKPNEPINLSQIDLYKPEDVPALLNLSAQVQ